MKSITAEGDTSATMADPDKFRELRVVYEKKLQKHLDGFQGDIRESEVVAADVAALKATYHARWQADCDAAERKGLAVKRNAFIDKVDASLAQLARRRMVTGPITPEALVAIGFRLWPDGTYRTFELIVERVNDDWRITPHGDLVRDFNMANILRLMDALEIKNLSPWNHTPDQIPAPVQPSLIKRLFRPA